MGGRGASHAEKSTDTTIVNGAFSISFAIPSAVQSNTYHVYLDLVPDWTDGDAPDGDTVAVIGDRVQVQSYTVVDAKVNINDNVNIDVLLWYDFDDTLVTDGTVTVNGYSAAHQGSGVRRITRSSAAVAAETYNTVAASGNTHGVSSVDQNGKSQQVIWDRLEVVSMVFSDSHIDIGAQTEVRYTLRYDYDDVVFDSGKGSVTGYAWDASGYWKKTITGSSSAGSENYDEADISFTDSTYGLTVIEDDAGAALITDALSCTAFVRDVADAKLYVRMLYAYDSAPVSGGTIAFAGLTPTTNSTGWAEFNLAGAASFHWEGQPMGPRTEAPTG